MAFELYSDVILTRDFSERLRHANEAISALE